MGGITLRKCQKLGKESSGKVSFTIMAAGVPRKCSWLDPWFGFFLVDGLDGFIMAGDFEDGEIICHNVTVEELPQ